MNHETWSLIIISQAGSRAYDKTSWYAFASKLTRKLTLGALPQKVQRIKNEFTVQVYEAHARMALEMVSDDSLLPFAMADSLMQEDLPEFNSCLNMLSGLYDLGIAGRRDEFTAYTILMLCYGRNFSGLFLLPR